MIENKVECDEVIEDWSKRTDFNGVSFIGYACDDGQVIKCEIDWIQQNINQILIRCCDAESHVKFLWLDAPNKRICHPTKKRGRKYTFSKYYVEYEAVDVNKYYIEFNKDDFNGLNLLHPNIFKLFKNIEYIEINVGYHGKYKFDLLQFLSVIMESGKTNITFCVTGRRGELYPESESEKEIDTWLCSCLTPSVLSSYNDNGWNIDYNKDFDSNGCVDNIFIDSICSD